MNKRIIAILMLAVLLLGALAGCGKEEPLTDEDVKQIVIDHMGVHERDVSDIHSHIAETDDGQVCFNVFITVNGKSYTYQIHAVTGEILSLTEGGHSH